MRQCQLYCEDCDVPTCILCIASRRHKAHDVVQLQDIFDVQKDKLKRDLQELRFSIYFKYQKYASEISKQIANIKKNSMERSGTRK